MCQFKTYQKNNWISLEKPEVKIYKIYIKKIRKKKVNIK